MMRKYLVLVITSIVLVSFLIWYFLRMYTFYQTMLREVEEKGTVIFLTEQNE